MVFLQKLLVTVDGSCQCPCEDPSLDEGFENNSETCSKNGDLTCGICSCYEDFSGSNCECDKISYLSGGDPE